MCRSHVPTLRAAVKHAQFSTAVPSSCAAPAVPSSSNARMPIVPVGCLLIRVRHRKNFVVGKEIADDGCAKRLRWRSRWRGIGAALGAPTTTTTATGGWRSERVWHDDRRMPGLAGQADITLAADVHVEVFH